MHILLEPKNKSAQEFYNYRKIQDGRQRSKVRNRPNLTPQITFCLDIWFPFIRFGENLAQTYYLAKKQVYARISQLAQNPRWPPEVKGPKSTKFASQITFRLVIWILFIRFGQSLAWTQAYYLTLQTNLSKNFSFSAKSKMAAVRRGSNV